MKVELEEFRAEATHLKNHQSTIRRLEERNRQLEQQMEENTKEVVEIKQRNQNTLELFKDSLLLYREQALQDQFVTLHSTMQKFACAGTEPTFLASCSIR
ncbi:hypothetical protein HID58_005697, partial [Brassica napus]